MRHHASHPLAAATLGVTLALVLSATAALAVGFFDRQANDPQVAGVSSSNATAVFPTNKQNEPSIAVDPTNANYVIAGSNDEQLQPPCGPGPVRGTTALRTDCSFFPGVGTSGVYTSSDGGITWTNRGLLPGYSDTGGSLVSGGDPVIVFGPKLGTDGRFSFADGAVAYYASLASYKSGSATGNQAPELLTVSISRDDGATWSGPVVAASAHGYVFNDKESIWVDRNPGSPFFGRVYVSWTQFRDIRGCAEPIMTASSADGGQTWSVPKQLSPAQNCGLGGRQGSTIRTGADGSVYIVWEDSDINGYKMVVAVSTDGGAAYSRPQTIAYTHDIADPIPGANFRTDSFASLGVDQSSGALYVAWADRSGTSANIVVSKSVNSGVSWSVPAAVSGAGEGYAFFQGLDVAPNGRVDIGYQALKATNTATYGTGNASINAWYVNSTDGGAHWSAPIKVSLASSDPAASAQNNLKRQFWGDYNTLVSTNTKAWFIYTDSRNGVGCAAVDAYQHYVDGSSSVAVSKPAPEDSCGSQFGNTDAQVSVITP